jgi:hypothetical protein
MGRSWKRKPWKLLGALLFMTAGLWLVGLDLLDGDITFRRLGHLTIDGTPAKFAFACVMYVISIPVTAALWLALLDEWRLDYRPLTKPQFDDPSKRSTL